MQELDAMISDSMNVHVNVQAGVEVHHTLDVGVDGVGFAIPQFEICSEDVHVGTRLQAPRPLMP